MKGVAIRTPFVLPLIERTFVAQTLIHNMYQRINYRLFPNEKVGFFVADGILSALRCITLLYGKRYFLGVFHPFSPRLSAKQGHCFTQTGPLFHPNARVLVSSANVGVFSDIRDFLAYFYYYVFLIGYVHTIRTSFDKNDKMTIWQFDHATPFFNFSTLRLFDS